MSNIYLILLSTAFVLLVLAFSTLVAKLTRGSSEITRKLIHILVGHWAFFTPFFTELWAVIFVPALFVVVNFLSVRYNLIPAMERDDDSYGTVYYALSLFLLAGGGFILDWPFLPLTGILIMAYGDGLAAIIGKLWGKKRPFAFAPDKTLVGSITLLVSAFIITDAIFFFYRQSLDLSLLEILLISALTAFFSAFIELIGSKGCDNLILPLASGLFASLSALYGSVGYYGYLILATLILILAYHKKAITVDGIAAALMTAATLYALGGYWVGTSLLVFFLLGTAVTKVKNDHKVRAESLQEPGSSRNWKQVLANSLPATLVVWAALLWQEPRLTLLGIAVFSAASADTFSSEIGMMSRGKVYNILTGKPMPSGLSGGVSMVGLVAGLVGSFTVALLALPDFGWKGLLVATALGFLGTLIDSVLGATLQCKYQGQDGGLQDRQSADAELVAGFAWITNNTVNLTTLCIIALCGIPFVL